MRSQKIPKDYFTNYLSVTMGCIQFLMGHSLPSLAYMLQTDLLPRCTVTMLKVNATDFTRHCGKINYPSASQSQIELNYKNN